MAEKVAAFSWAEIADNATNPTREARDRALGGLAQMCLQFAEGKLDRVKILRGRRQIDQPRARRFDRLLDAGDLVHREIVHEYRFAALERWNKALFHPGEKHRPIHGSLKHERRDHRALPQAADEGDH